MDTLWDGQLAARILVSAINEELADLLGGPGREALNFHVDPEIAADSPAEYQARLMRVLGDEGSKLLILKLRDRMCKLSGRAPKLECPDIRNCLHCIEESRNLQPVGIQGSVPSVCPPAERPNRPNQDLAE